MNLRPRISLLLAPILLVLACGDDHSDASLRGSWQEVGGKQNLVFRSDTLLTWDEGASHQPAFLPWRYVDSMKIVIGEGASTAIVEVEISGELMKVNGEAEFVREILPANHWASRWLEREVSTERLIFIADSVTAAATASARERAAEAEALQRMRAAEAERIREEELQRLYGETELTAAMVERGQKVFSGAGICSTCHGSRGQGLPNLGLDLTDDEWLHSDGSYAGIVRTVLEGIPARKSTSGVPMPPRGGANISERQVRDVAAFVYTLRF